MPSFSPQALQQSLRSLGAPEASAYCVAFSGGLDSTVLLHALVHGGAGARSWRVRAVHVDHQMHDDSADWAAHCARVAAQLGIDLLQQRVRVSPGREGWEAAARRARYIAFREILEPGEILLTAHHADDQLETMLLALVRGAGAPGLSGVLADQPFGAGRMMRPLLDWTRASLLAWAQQQHLVWLEDPSNANVDLDRNYLRERVTPLLRERWPAAARGAARSARHLAQAREVMERQGRADHAMVACGDCLDVAKLITLDPARRRNLLRLWIRMRGAHAPSSRRLAQIEESLLTARQDRTPCVQWDDVEVRRYRGKLYLEAQQPSIEAADIVWRTQEPVDLPAQLGRLRLESCAAGGLSRSRLATTLVVRFRLGGEKLQPAGQAHHRSLKKLLQSHGVPPWRRSRLPLIYSQGRLAAVGDLWVAQEFAAAPGEEAVRVVWEGSESVRTARS